MLRLIYRQRRRIVFCTFLTMLGLYLTMTNLLGPSENSAWLWYFLPGLLILSLVVAAVFSLLIILFKNSRFLIDAFGLIFFIIAAFGAVWPSYDLFLYPVGMFLPVITFFVLHSIIYGELLDRFPLWVGHTTRHSFKSNLTPEQMWALFVPTHENKDTFWDPFLHDVTPEDDDSAVQYATFNHGASVFSKQRQQFTELQAPHKATYLFDGDVSAKNKPITGGKYTVEIKPTETGGCTVTETTTHDALLPRIGLLMWFDDIHGSVIDCFLARQRGKRDWSTEGRARRKIASLS